MADYIKREDALKWLEDSEIGFYDDEPIQTRNRALKIIQNIPAADVRPVVRGRWIEKERPTGVEAFGVKEMTVDTLGCSCCGFSICGADMREVDDLIELLESGSERGNEYDDNLMHKAAETIRVLWEIAKDTWWRLHP